MITVKHLTKRYGPVTAVNDVSFDIKKGEIVGLLGPNGAGKTTTLKILTCFMPGNSGEIKIAGHDVYTDSLAVRKKIGYLPEHAPLYDELNVGEYLEYVAAMHDIPADEIPAKIREVAKTCGLEDKLLKEISELSKGYKQRVGLAQALIHSPPILILDEPTSGLDPNQIVEIRNLIKKIGQEKTIILSTHILSEVEATCDRVFIINKGEIVASGTVSELKSRAGGTKHLHIRVNDAKQDKSLIKKIQSLEGVEKVEKLPSEERNTTSLRIDIDAGKDLRKEIGKLLITNNYDLLEIRQEEQSLESVFAKLTKK